MKKGRIFGILILLIVLETSIVFASNSLDRNEINLCRRTCTDNLKTNNNLCNENYKACYNECKIVTDSISKRECMNFCSMEKRACFDEAKFRFADCPQNCNKKYTYLNVKCLNDKYNAGDVFLDGCNICKCKFNGEVQCKKTLYCNFKDLNADKSTCESAGGFYYPLCNGPYFDIVCTQGSFCICSGIENYNCPTGYSCIKDFTLSMTRKSQTIPGWKTLLGFSLGDIGICAKNPELASCGNGICENVLKEKVFTFAETRFNCPEDCP